MRRRSSLLAALAAGSVFVLITLPGGVEGLTIVDVSVMMDRSDFYVNGMSPTATVTVGYTAGDPQLLEDVQLSWWRPDGSLARNVLRSVSGTGEATDQLLLDQAGNWWLNATYVGNAPEQCNLGCYDNVTFLVLSEVDAVIVSGVSVSLMEEVVEENYLELALISLDYVGNGSLLGVVTVAWFGEDGSLIFPMTPHQPNETGVVTSSWFVDQLGTGLRVEATYSGSDPEFGVAYFDAVPRRVDTWLDLRWPDGIISSSASLGPADGTLGACVNITVRAGATLTIEPGTTVRFCDGVSLVVEGRLLAEGLEGAPIVLTTYEHIPQKAAPGDWNGIVIQPNATPGSRMSHARIEYATDALAVLGGDPSLSNLYISNASYSGMVLDSVVITVSDIAISHAHYGIEAVDSDFVLVGGNVSGSDRGIVLTSSTGTITAATISWNLDIGVFGTDCSLLLADSTLEGNTNQAIRLERCADVEVSGTSLSGGNYIFRAKDSTRISVLRCSLSDPVSRVFDLSNVTEMTIANSTISSVGPNTIDLLLINSVVTTVNSSFSVDKLSVLASQLHVKNFLHLFVGTPDSSPLAGAEVSVAVNGVVWKTMTTGEDGWIRWILLEDSLYDQNGLTKRDNSVTVELAGYVVDDAVRVVDLPASRTEVFTAAVPSSGYLWIGLDSQSWLMVVVIVIFAVILAAAGLRRRRLATAGAPSLDEGMGSSTSPELEQLPLEPGKAYMVPGEDSEVAFRLFGREMERGSSGLCITRSHPADVEATHPLDSAKIRWLSRDTKGGGVKPTNLGAIARDVDRFLSEAQDVSPVVMLDGLEYLIVQNDFSKVLKLGHALTDAVSVRGARLLIPFNLKAVDATKRALLTRDFKVLDA